MKYIVVVLLLLCSAQVGAADAEDFAKMPAVSSPQISPDGKSVAFLMTHEGEPVLITKAISSKDKDIKPGAMPLNGAHMQWFRWVNNERLLVAIRMSSDFLKKNYSFVRIFSVDRSGLDPVYFEMKASKYRFRLSWPRLVHLLPDDPKHVLLRLDPDYDTRAAMVHKVNVYTGEKELVEANRKKFSYFIPDSKGNIRVGVRHRKKSGVESLIYYRETEKSDWIVLEKTRVLSNDELWPIRFDYERDYILLLSSVSLEDDNYDQDDNDWYEYDLNQRKIIGPYKREALDKTAKKLKELLPGRRVSLVSSTDKVTLDKAFYRVYGDIYPEQYYLYDRSERRVDFFADAYPQLEGVTLSKMQEVNYKARDGLNIPAYLTVPQQYEDKEKPKLPTIIFPHGGPWARDYWRYNNYVQFFASKGYVVLQPQFRGSEGFGYDHLSAGFKQWGLKIQDDINDGLQWLIDEGVTDADNVCIVGASFGGYAASAALALTPDLYKCAVSINGVHDMAYIRKAEMRYSYLEREIVNDSWGIKKISPIHQAKNITSPMLIIVGEKDSVVEPKHSYKMKKKLKKLKRPYEFLALPNGEHWRTIESNEIKKFNAMDKFLSKYLAKAS